LEGELRAITYDTYGSPDVLSLREVATPVPDSDQVLVKVMAAGLNPFDWHLLRGEPYLMRPSMGLTRPQATRVLGADVSGEVVAVGDAVTGLAVGDEVFGSIGFGGCADFVAAQATRFAFKPTSLSFEQAAALPMGGITALQALRDVAALEPGQRVLVNGASGGVGHVAVQIAKALGASQVTAVCSGRNAPMVKDLGADEVIDYTEKDFTAEGAGHDGKPFASQPYDLILDMIGNHRVRALCRVLTPRGKVVVVGATANGTLLGPAAPLLRALVDGVFVSQKVLPSMNTTVNRADFEQLAEWADAGLHTPILDRVFPLESTADALRYVETGRVAGKVVVSVTD
jgi:NADPH:quinone reductase-like Zn-dependent oxidoreductase